VTDRLVSFGARVALAFASFFSILFDAAFAGRVLDAREPGRALPPAEPTAPPEPKQPERKSNEPALQLLALLQREGRLVDFLQQDVSAFGDAEIGAAARVVHDGCAKALKSHATIEPVRGEAEGARVTLDAGFDARAIKLTGNVGGSAPYSGVLRHKGWRADRLELPLAVGDHDASVLAPAEVEL
jgi:Domain of unknown function (DUF2760)